MMANRFSKGPVAGNSLIKDWLLGMSLQDQLLGVCSSKEQLLGICSSKDQLLGNWLGELTIHLKTSLKKFPLICQIQVANVICSLSDHSLGGHIQPCCQCTNQVTTDLIRTPYESSH